LEDGLYEVGDDVVVVVDLERARCGARGWGLVG
jgi:hypothetical protein